MADQEWYQQEHQRRVAAETQLAELLGQGVGEGGAREGRVGGFEANTDEDQEFEHAVTTIRQNLRAHLATPVEQRDPQTVEDLFDDYANAVGAYFDNYRARARRYRARSYEYRNQRNRAEQYIQSFRRATQWYFGGQGRGMDPAIFRTAVADTYSSVQELTTTINEILANATVVDNVEQQSDSNEPDLELPREDVNMYEHLLARIRRAITTFRRFSAEEALAGQPPQVDSQVQALQREIGNRDADIRNLTRQVNNFVVARGDLPPEQYCEKEKAEIARLQKELAAAKQGRDSARSDLAQTQRFLREVELGQRLVAPGAGAGAHPAPVSNDVVRQAIEHFNQYHTDAEASLDRINRLENAIRRATSGVPGDNANADRVRALEAERQADLAQYDAAQAEHDRVVEELRRANGELQQQLADTRAQLEIVNGNVADNLETSNQLEARCNQLLAQIAQLESLHPNAPAPGMDSAERDRLVRERGEAMQAHENAIAEVNRHAREKEVLEGRIRQLTTQLEDNEEAQRRDEDINLLHQEILNMDAQIALYAEEMEMRIAHETELQDQITELENRRPPPGDYPGDHPGDYPGDYPGDHPGDHPGDPPPPPPPPPLPGGPPGETIEQAQIRQLKLWLQEAQAHPTRAHLQEELNKLKLERAQAEGTLSQLMEIIGGDDPFEEVIAMRQRILALEEQVRNRDDQIADARRDHQEEIRRLQDELAAEKRKNAGGGDEDSDDKKRIKDLEQRLADCEQHRAAAAQTLKSNEEQIRSSRRRLADMAAQHKRQQPRGGTSQGGSTSSDVLKLRVENAQLKQQLEHTKTLLEDPNIKDKAGDPVVDYQNEEHIKRIDQLNKTVDSYQKMLRELETQLSKRPTDEDVATLHRHLADMGRQLSDCLSRGHPKDQENYIQKVQEGLVKIQGLEQQVRVLLRERDHARAVLATTTSDFSKVQSRLNTIITERDKLLGESPIQAWRRLRIRITADLPKSQPPVKPARAKPITKPKPLVPTIRKPPTTTKTRPAPTPARKKRKSSYSDDSDYRHSSDDPDFIPFSKSEDEPIVSAGVSEKSDELLRVPAPEDLEDVGSYEDDGKGGRRRKKKRVSTVGGRSPRTMDQTAKRRKSSMVERKKSTAGAGAGAGARGKVRFEDKQYTPEVVQEEEEGTPKPGQSIEVQVPQSGLTTRLRARRAAAGKGKR